MPSPKGKSIYISETKYFKPKRTLKCMYCHKPMIKKGELAYCKGCEYGLNLKEYERIGWQNYKNNRIK